MERSGSNSNQKCLQTEAGDPNQHMVEMLRQQGQTLVRCIARTRESKKGKEVKEGTENFRMAVATSTPNQDPLSQARIHCNDKVAPDEIISHAEFLH